MPTDQAVMLVVIPINLIILSLINSSFLWYIALKIIKFKETRYKIAFAVACATAVTATAITLPFVSNISRSGLMVYSMNSFKLVLLMYALLFFVLNSLFIKLFYRESYRKTLLAGAMLGVFGVISDYLVTLATILALYVLALLTMSG